MGDKDPFFRAVNSSAPTDDDDDYEISWLRFRISSRHCSGIFLLMNSLAPHRLHHNFAYLKFISKNRFLITLHSKRSSPNSTYPYLTVLTNLTHAKVTMHSQQHTLSVSNISSPVLIYQFLKVRYRN